MKRIPRDLGPLRHPRTKRTLRRQHPRLPNWSPVVISLQLVGVRVRIDAVARGWDAQQASRGWSPPAHWHRAWAHSQLFMGFVAVETGREVAVR